MDALPSYPRDGHHESGSHVPDVFAELLIGALIAVWPTFVGVPAERFVMARTAQRTSWGFTYRAASFALPSATVVRGFRESTTVAMSLDALGGARALHRGVTLTFSERGDCVFVQAPCNGPEMTLWLRQEGDTVSVWSNVYPAGTISSVVGLVGAAIALAVFGAPWGIAPLAIALVYQLRKALHSIPHARLSSQGFADVVASYAVEAVGGMVASAVGAAPIAPEEPAEDATDASLRAGSVR
ncbi:MAG: hypothetical protein HOO96_43605 [Polyangiaceae bacterium]|nr:hypothetical protein [Polyangiaceae bacterium]